MCPCFNVNRCIRTSTAWSGISPPRSCSRSTSPKTYRLPSGPAQSSAACTKVVHTQPIPDLKCCAIWGGIGVSRCSRRSSSPVLSISVSCLPTHVIETFGEPVWIVSQGPQVLLDAQVTELRGGLLAQLGRPRVGVPAGPDRCHVRQVYRMRSQRLAEGDAGWDAEAAVRLPALRRRYVPRSTRLTARSAGGVCIRASSSMPRRTRMRRQWCGVWATPRGSGAMGNSPSAHLLWRGRCAPAACDRATRSPSSYPRDGTKSWPSSEYLPPGQRTCRSDSTSRMAARQDSSDR